MKTKIKKLEKKIDIYKIFKHLYEKDRTISFLDSSLKNKYGEYSIIGMDMYLELKKDNGELYINNKKSNNSFESYLKDYLKNNKEENTTNLPIISGGIGCFSYDYGMEFENITTKHKKDLSIPEVVVRFYNTFIIEDFNNLYIAYKNEDSLNYIENLISNLQIEKENIFQKDICAEFKSNFSKEEYFKKLQNMIDYIIEGDIYIANMTQRLQIKSTKKPLEVFEYLRKFNPSPFGAFLDYGNFQLICASPERFIKIKDKYIQTRPIKGTRRRGVTKEEDECFKKDLINSSKDKSELLMIVDLERNDLNKICELGSVKVTELFKVEIYSTVFHLVSTIVGKVKDKYDFVDVLKAIFPGGSITGAPKIRAMEIIDELENSNRTFYTGTLGYIAFDGSCDMNIIIRTVIYNDFEYYLGVGGGITCESELNFEYQETLQKANAILKALN